MATHKLSKYNDSHYTRRRDERFAKKIKDLNSRYPQFEYYLDEKKITIPPKKRGNRYTEGRESVIICIQKRKRS